MIKYKSTDERTKRRLEMEGLKKEFELLSVVVEGYYAQFINGVKDLKKLDKQIKQAEKKKIKELQKMNTENTTQNQSPKAHYLTSPILSTFADMLYNQIKTLDNIKEQIKCINTVQHYSEQIGNIYELVDYTKKLYDTLPTMLKEVTNIIDDICFCMYQADDIEELEGDNLFYLYIKQTAEKEPHKFVDRN